MPRRTGRPPIERNLDAPVRIATLVPGHVFNQLLEESKKRGTSIGAEAGRLVRRAMDLETVFSRRTLDSVQSMNRVYAHALQLAQDTGNPEPFEILLVDICKRIWTEHPARTPKAEARVKEGLEQMFARREAYDQIAIEDTRQAGTTT